MHVIDLLLKLTSEILDLFLLLLQVDIELLCLSTQASVLISCDIVLDLEVSVHISHLFFLSGLEYRRLVSLNHIGLSDHTGRVVVVNTASHTSSWLLHRHISTAEQDIATAVVVDNLLIDTIAFLGTAVREAATCLHTLVHGAHMHRVVELLRARGPSNERLRRVDCIVKQLSVGRWLIAT